MQYQFDRDPAKETRNIRKHEINFRRAATIFNDPNHLAMFDDEHSTSEDRWITMGIVVHTYKQMNEKLCEIRIISARKATIIESNQYNEGINQ